MTSELIAQLKSIVGVAVLGAAVYLLTGTEALALIKIVTIVFISIIGGIAAFYVAVSYDLTTVMAYLSAFFGAFFSTYFFGGLHKLGKSFDDKPSSLFAWLLSRFTKK